MVVVLKRDVRNVCVFVLKERSVPLDVLPVAHDRVLYTAVSGRTQRRRQVGTKISIIYQRLQINLL